MPNQQDTHAQSNETGPNQQTVNYAMKPYTGFLTGLGIFTAICIGTAFSIVGNPYFQQKINNDEERYRDFSQIYYQINEYYRSNGELPGELDPLTAGDDESLKDPVTGDYYEYEIVNETEYRICAEFETSREEFSLQRQANYYREIEFEHDKGRSCFDGEIPLYVQRELGEAE